MALETLIGMIFPNKRLSPQQSKAAGFPFGTFDPNTATAPFSPGLEPIAARERMISGNPAKIVGDALTRMGGGDPDASVLDEVDPTRSRTTGRPGGGFWPGITETGTYGKEQEKLSRKNVPTMINTAFNALGVPSNLPPGEDSDFYPNGVRKSAMDERMPDGTPFLDAGIEDGFYPGSNTDRETYKTQIVPPTPPANADRGGLTETERRQVEGYANLPDVRTNDFYPGGPTENNNLIRSIDELPKTGVTTAETGGFYPGMDTPKPSTGPVKRKLTKAERRRKQDEFEAEFETMTPEEKQQALLEGKAPVEHSFLKRLAAGALRGLASGGLGGAAVGAAAEGFFPGMNRQMNAQTQLPRVTAAIEAKNKAGDVAQKRRRGQVEIENIEEDNRLNRERLKYLKDDQERKIGDRKSREATARMNAVAGMFKNLPAYDPNDPKFAEITKALGEVNLPITAKDAKKNIKLVQDQRTGAWSTILTDTISGKQETRPVLDSSGKQLATTPTVVMQGEYGMLKQNDQQDFQASENEKSRKQALTIAGERIAIAKENLKLAQQRAVAADEKNKAQAQEDVRKAKQSMIRLKAYLKNSPLISPDDEIWQEFEELDNQ